MNCGANCVEQCLFVSAIVIHSLSGYKMFAVIRKGVTVVQSWRDGSYDPSWHSNGLRWIKSVIFSVYGEFSCYQWHQRIKWLVSSMETVCRTGVGPVSIPRDAGWQSPEISGWISLHLCGDAVPAWKSVIFSVWNRQWMTQNTRELDVVLAQCRSRPLVKCKFTEL